MTRKALYTSISDSIYEALSEWNVKEAIDDIGEVIEDARSVTMSILTVVTWRLRRKRRCCCIFKVLEKMVGRYLWDLP